MMMQPEMKRIGEHAYFAASNSRAGFRSYYEQCFRGRVDHLYCIKGGINAGLEVVYCDNIPVAIKDTYPDLAESVIKLVDSAIDDFNKSS